ncbi:MAG: glutamine synthetase family protein, partial [Terriglobia bacterium]
IHGENGSGMHTHQSLFKKDKNAFYDGSDSEKLSKTARGFIAGQLKHAREISAIFAQWPNSYKRLVPGYEAPIYVAWSHRNRSALIRVPYHTPGKESQVRSEFRSPDPACNPYLTFAVMLEAGLDGIEKGYDLPDPIDKNLYNLSDKERADLGINALPENLGEALAEMEKSSLVKKVLGKHIFGRFLKLKTAEWREYQSQITEFEIDRYLPIL